MVRQQIRAEYFKVYEEVKKGKLTEIPIAKGNKTIFCGENENWGLTTGQMRKTGKPGDIDSQSGFVGYLLKYHVVVITFEHDGAGIRLVVARRRAAAA